MKRRRDFIVGLGSAAAVWPLAARAQQPDRPRRIGVLFAIDEADPEAQARVKALRDGLQVLGWIDGRNIQIAFRFAGGNVERARTLAAELVRFGADVIVANRSEEQ